MAKKNSSKTATEKAIQSSEPKVISFRNWQGVNFVDAPLTWDPMQSGKDEFRQTNLPQNFLMVQNNVDTTQTLALETRQDSKVIGRAGDLEFTGVAAIYKKWLFVAAKGDYECILYRDITGDDVDTWSTLHLEIDGVEDPTGCEISEIGFFESNIVVTVRDTRTNPDTGVLLLARVTVPQNESSITIKGMDWSTQKETRTNMVVDTPKICPTTDRPGVSPVIVAKGGMVMADEYDDSTPVKVEIKFCYTNRLGSTLTQEDADCVTKYVEMSPALWSTKKYVVIKPAAGESEQDSPHSSATGVDLYARENDNLDWVFIGHVETTAARITAGTWKYNWYGNMTDITQWLTSQLMVPTDNTTHGPDASHFGCHDSRIYYWGMPSKPYRLWIGGNPGAEFSTARGLGGAWVDIEPGSGYDIMGTAKWKTVQGSNIVTIMCGNSNTNKVKRFNLVETNLAFTNEVTYKSYMYEEVANVVGCNSRWGYGVYDDGLYSLSRYGLMLTTMAMEYNAQMRNQNVSAAIQPIFTDRLGKRLKDGRMVCVDGVIYIALSEEAGANDGEPVGLDNVILCYDIGLKSWYTWTHDQALDETIGDDRDHILHIMAIDSDQHHEGIGAITKEEVRLYPVTGIQDPVVPEFQALIETAELMPKMPMQAFWYVQQLELRFDYFVGDPHDPATVLVEGVDYYGRSFTIEKKLNVRSRGNHGKAGEQRNYVEWIRIDKIVESLRIRIKGHVRFRLTHMNMKIYQQADVIGTPYGFDARDTYVDRHGDQHVIHHYIDDYNNLRRAVVS